MRTVHLFAGAGGGLLGDLILGHEPVAAVEIDPYCCQVLRERAEAGWFPGLQVFERDIRMLSASDIPDGVDLIHAGFPCQDISSAGNGAGIRHGKRSGLWSEVVRLAGEIRPRYLFLENVPTITRRGLDIVLSDLASLGFDAEWLVLSASAVGAPHRRSRWWCLARNSDSNGEPALPVDDEVERVPRDVADANGEGLEVREQGAPGEQSPTIRRSWWSTEPDVGRVAHGVASRVDRIRALGNGQVPLQAAVAYTILRERMNR